MPYNNSDIIFVITPKIGYIPHLRTAGPIPNPIRVPVATCLSMITAGIELHQFDPDSKEIVKLTFDNLFDDNKFSTPITETMFEENIPPYQEPDEAPGTGESHDDGESGGQESDEEPGTENGEDGEPEVSVTEDGETETVAAPETTPAPTQTQPQHNKKKK